jgi:radical SAM superfamily enzyme YgiQ (UPF0313 family)
MSVVAAALTAVGHEVDQFDLLAEGWDFGVLRQRILKFAPLCVGLSLRNVDNVDSLTASKHWFLDEAREAVKNIRQCTSAPIVVGGAGFSLIPERILDYTGADYGIVGGGENAFAVLLAILEEGGSPQRLTVNGTQRASATEMPSALMKPEYVRFYLEGSGLVGVQTKRGCPNACCYCSYPLLEGHAVRCRDPRDVAEDLLRLQQDHGVRTVFFTDAVFNDAGGLYLGLVEELVRRDIGMSWTAYFQPRCLDRHTVRLLRRSGLIGLEVGTDAASDATLSGLGKGIDFAAAADFNAMCVGEGLPCAHFIIFGGPGETSDTLEEGLRNLSLLDPAVVFAFSGIRVHPRTRLHALAVEQGVIGPDADLLRPVFYFSPEVYPEAMNARLEQAFARRRDRIFPPERAQERMAVLHRLGYRGVLWDTLVRLPGAQGGHPQ